MKRFWLIAFGALLIVSCKKDEDKQTVYPDYGNLKVGNYWIYQHFEIDTNGVETAMDEFDSCYIEKDTVINGITYFKMVRPTRLHFDFFRYYWRDSLDYIIDTAGNIRFSAEDFITVFDTTYELGPEETDTSYMVTSRMVDKDKMVTTPVGNFVTRTFQVKYDLSEWLHSLTPRYSNMRFSKDVGIVSETLEIYASDPKYRERRLVRYGSSE